MGISIFKHRHKWQARARSMYGNTTYRVCVKRNCGKCEQWKGGVDGQFEECEPIPEFDKQFDKDNKYIFNH